MIQKLLSFLGLFTALGTLLCCALPALFVLLGAGASFAALTRSVPQIIWVGEHKDWVFIVGGVSLFLGVFLPRIVPPSETCTLDEATGETPCEQTKDWTTIVLKLAIVAYVIGFSFAYVLPLLF